MFPTKSSKLQMASNDNTVWTPEMAIHFGSLDFIVNKKGELTEAPEAPTLLTSDLPSVASGLGDLQLVPLSRSAGRLIPRSWGCWTPSRIHS